MRKFRMIYVEYNSCEKDQDGDIFYKNVGDVRIYTIMHLRNRDCKKHTKMVAKRCFIHEKIDQT